MCLPTQNTIFEPETFLLLGLKCYLTYVKLAYRYWGDRIPADPSLQVEAP